MNIKHHNLIVLLVITLFSAGCGVYSFTGASIPPGAKTVSVQYFQNRAQLIEPTLSSYFTDALRDIFVNQTTLKMVDRNGDLALDGEIVDYKTSPEAIQGDQTAALNRLTITVNVRFVNKLEPEKDFEQKFTQYKDYSSDTDLSAVKDDLISEITDMLTTDIFNKAVVNW